LNREDAKGAKDFSGLGFKFPCLPHFTTKTFAPFALLRFNPHH
jgi:hypothetical protein